MFFKEIPKISVTVMEMATLFYIISDVLISIIFKKMNMFTFSSKFEGGHRHYRVLAKILCDLDFSASTMK